MRHAGFLSRLFRWKAGPTVKIDALLGTVKGGTVIVGEHHADRVGLRTTLELIARADRLGYRKLGVETCLETAGMYLGLVDERAFLQGLRKDDLLSEYDERSYMDADASGRKPRLNRHWQIRAALALGWEIIPFDPFHWRWQLGTEDGYLHSREPAMAESIRSNGPLIAVCGYGHLAGLHRLLGPEASYAVCSRVKQADGDRTFWKDRIRFAAGLPLLTS